jgi:urease accessory protein
MLRVSERLQGAPPAQATLTLSFELRQKSRLLTRLDSGEEVGLFLPRGQVLRDGDRLRAEDGRVIAVRAARETVSTVSGGTLLDRLRAAYHLGNRHVPLQVAEDWLRYLHDHVLDDLVRRMGLQVAIEEAPFEPEAGAYGGGNTHAH